MNKKLTENLSQIFLRKVGGKSASAWLQMADVLRVENLSDCEEREKVDVALKQTPAGRRNLASYRSKILDLTHPGNPKVFEAARKARVEINDLIAIARGSKTFKDGNVVVVSKSAAGGWNEKSATQKIRESFDLAFTTGTQAGISFRELKLIFNERLNHAEGSAS